MIRHLRGAALTGVALLSACSDPLTVRNTNVVDVTAAQATVQGNDQIIGKSFQAIFQGQFGAAVDNINAQTMNLAGESSASVANGGMNVRNGIPRLTIDNALGNQTQTGNNRDFSFYTRLARQNVNAMRALDGLPVAAETPRARAFGYFVLGYAMGHMAMVYDSAAILTPSRAPTDSLFGAAAVMTQALNMLDSAIAVANANPTISIPGTNMTGAAIGQARFIQIARSFKARFRAGLARTPAERAAVNWTEVLNDATAGITTNLNVVLDPTIGWSHGTIVQLMLFLGWHQMPSLYIGMADTSATGTAYYSAPLTGTGARNGNVFTIRTPDRRFPVGDTRTAQQNFQSPTVPLTGVYFRNRPNGEDTPNNSDAWSNSQYDHFRFRPIRDANGAGTWVLMSAEEVAMLRAEALIRLNRVSEAIPLINTLRTRNNLPAIPTTAALTDPVPGGTACVPRVPTAPTFALACGNVLEAMKYEKRMETAFTGYAQWWIDGRGWGDLVQGTPIEWPVPFQELNSRGKPIYQNTRVSGASTYGFGRGGGF